MLFLVVVYFIKLQALPNNIQISVLHYENCSHIQALNGPVVRISHSMFDSNSVATNLSVVSNNQE